MNIDTGHFKALLEAEKQALEEQLSGIAEPKSADETDWVAKQDVPNDSADREDVAGALENFENNESTIGVLETQLNEVKHALDKIENGTYGICEISGEQIELDRLEANPSARTSKAHMNDR
jgi:RNA polymerase-binding transcription factor DksA